MAELVFFFFRRRTFSAITNICLFILPEIWCICNFLKQCYQLSQISSVNYKPPAYVMDMRYQYFTWTLFLTSKLISSHFILVILTESVRVRTSDRFFLLFVSPLGGSLLLHVSIVTRKKCKEKAKILKLSEVRRNVLIWTSVLVTTVYKGTLAPLWERFDTHILLKNLGHKFRGNLQNRTLKLAT